MASLLSLVEASEAADETSDEIALVALDATLLASETMEETTEDSELVGGTIGMIEVPPPVPATVDDGRVDGSPELEGETSVWVEEASGAEDSETGLGDATEVEASEVWCVDVDGAVGEMVVDGVEPVEPPNIELISEVALLKSEFDKPGVLEADGVGRTGFEGTPWLDGEAEGAAEEVTDSSELEVCVEALKVEVWGSVVGDVVDNGVVDVFVVDGVG